MTHWNYRVVRHCEQGEPYYVIHEAYYEEDGSISLTECPIEPWGENLEDLKSAVVLMATAFTKAVIDYETMKEIE